MKIDSINEDEGDVGVDRKSPKSLLDLLEVERRPKCAEALRRRASMDAKKRFLSRLRSRLGYTPNSTNLAALLQKKGRPRTHSAPPTGNPYNGCGSCGQNQFPFFEGKGMSTLPGNLSNVSLNTLFEDSVINDLTNNTNTPPVSQVTTNGSVYVHSNALDTLVSSSCKLIVQLESALRDSISLKGITELSDMIRKHDDQLSSLVASHFLIKALEQPSASNSDNGCQRSNFSMHQHTLSQGSVTPKLGERKLTCNSRGSPLGCSLTIQQKSRLSPYPDNNDLSSTQATVVVRDDEDDISNWPWEGIDKDVQLPDHPSRFGRRLKSVMSEDDMLATSTVIRNPTSINDDILDRVAIGEYNRQKTEIHDLLMALVSRSDPLAAVAIHTCSETGEPVKLGEGSFGTVILADIIKPELFMCDAVNENSHSQTAVKLIDLDDLEEGDSEVRDNILNEIMVMSNVQHPNIVSYFGTFFDKSRNTLWCSMEYCRGKSLHEIVFPGGVTQRILQDSEIAKVAIDILKPLHYLSSKGWVHRDIKLENILSDGRSSFKLSDFGLTRSCDVNGEITSNLLEGTLHYLGPEGFNTLHGLITGRPTCSTSHRGDVYAFGICLLMMAGINTSRKIIRPESYSPPRFKPRCFGPDKIDLKINLSSLLYSFVCCCLADDPSQRSTADELLRHPFIVSYCSAGLINSTSLFGGDSPRPHPNAHLLLPLALAHSAASFQKSSSIPPSSCSSDSSID